MEVEITWGRVLRVWWAYLWRNLIAIIAAFIISFVAGFIITLALASLGVAGPATKLVSQIVGAVIGLAISIVPMWMIIGKRFGTFRLVLVQAETASGAIRMSSPSNEPHF
jgi:hypothetical protein